MITIEPPDGTVLVLKFSAEDWQAIHRNDARAAEEETPAGHRWYNESWDYAYTLWQLLRDAQEVYVLGAEAEDPAE